MDLEIIQSFVMMLFLIITSYSVAIDTETQ